MPEVVEAYFLTGDSDYLLRVRVKDTDHYRDFLRDLLLKIPKSWVAAIVVALRIADCVVHGDWGCRSPLFR